MIMADKDAQKLELKKLYSQVQDLSALFGGGMAASAMSAPKVSPLGAGIGGALQGFGMAGLLGAPIGLIGGLIGGAKRRAEQDAIAQLEYDNMISSKRADPSYYAKSGAVLVPIEKDEAITVQAEPDEVAALPSGMIADVMATKTHKQKRKEKDEPKVTDVFPGGTFIGENNVKLLKKDAEKIVFGAVPQIYTESGKKNKEYKEIRLSDVWGNKKKLTPAEALNKVKKKIPIPQYIEDEIADPFAKATAESNKKTRAKYISGIMELSARQNPKLRAEMDAIAKLQNQQ